MTGKVLITGAGGQIGSELVPYLSDIYGAKNVIAVGHKKRLPEEISRVTGGVYYANCATRQGIRLLADVIKKETVRTIYHMAAILSVTAELKPRIAWKVNIDGLWNILDIATEYKCSVFAPSSIAVFGPTTPLDNTPQDTIQRPGSIYGISKVTGELLCDYYYQKHNVDVRGVRYPGIISNVTMPGGGTTDYAVDIFYQAIEKGRYTCYLEETESLDMMYMPDALRASVELMEADSAKLIHRNSFNVTAMSITPKMLANEIKKHIPDFKMKYRVDQFRQKIARSWPNYMDDFCAFKEWGWKPGYDLSKMTEDMIKVLSQKKGR